MQASGPAALAARRPEESDGILLGARTAASGTGQPPVGIDQAGDDADADELVGVPEMQSPYTLYKLTWEMDWAAWARAASHEGEGEGEATVQLHAEAMEDLVLLLTKAVCSR